MHALDILDDYVWTKPDHYAGFSPDGDYMILARHRDSDLITESNWYTVRQELDRVAAELPKPTDDGEHNQGDAWVYDWRASHWAVGWIEYLMIRTDAPVELKTAAGEILSALADYPIFDDMDCSEREHDAMVDIWENASIAERMDYCRDADISIFAARRNEVPIEHDHSGMLRETLIGY